MSNSAKSDEPDQLGRVGKIVIFAFVITVFGLMAGPFLLDGWREQQVLKHGADATATILQLEDTKDRANENPIVRLTVEVTPAAGEPYRASIVTPISVVDLKNYDVGGAIRVRYDPEDPSKVALVGPLLEAGAKAPSPAGEKAP